jgi:hypothetical protein
MLQLLAEPREEGLSAPLPLALGASGTFPPEGGLTRALAFRASGTFPPEGGLI